jgi:hypothetical protein
LALAAGQAARALDGIHGWIIEPDQQEEIRPVKNGPFLSFPYVCPEPVLVKRSFLYINGSKGPILDQTNRDVWPHLNKQRPTAGASQQFNLARRACSK